jgi:hypothetical protein
MKAATGLRGYFISKEDLIAAKLAAGRLRHLADVEEIREAANTTTPNNNDTANPGDPSSGV